MRHGVPVRVCFCISIGFFLILGPGAAWAQNDPSLALWAQAVTQPPSAKPNSTDSDSAPKPAIAFGLALFPGVLAHGQGHFYAGRPLTGSLLLAAELGSFYLMARGGMEVAASGQNILDAFHASPNGNAGQFGGNTENFSLGVGLAAAGLVVFLGSWFYDLAGAPIAAQEKAKAIKAAGLTLQPTVTARLDPLGMALVVDGF